jgi:gamma-glutamyltranspeptidase / glutathione hydrolase
MTPTIVLGPDDKPFLVTGARGGPRIISAVFQILSNVLDYTQPLEKALAAPRIHHQHLPDILYYERKGLTAGQVKGLESMGHRLQEREGYIGAAPTIVRQGQFWIGAADPRSGGGAISADR